MTGRNELHPGVLHTADLDLGERRSDSGAVLILVMVFLTVVSLIVVALISWSANDLGNTRQFVSSRSLQFAASSVTENAIQSMRYIPLLSVGQTLNASPPTSCWGSTQSALTVDGDNVAVWCSTAWNPTSAATRVVTLSTCLSGVAAVACTSAPLLQTVVTFNDYPPGINTPSPGLCVVFCGTGMTLNSWVWYPVMPTVTDLGTGPISGPITGGTGPLTIDGTGFVTGATVNFVDTTSAANIIVPAFNVTVNSSTSMTAYAPAVLIGTSYYVTVTTPAGTSAASSSNIFTYSLVAPLVTALLPNRGSTSGGTSVLITGTGFVTNATVNFVQESLGTPTSPSVVIPAVSVVVNGPTTITASSPPVTAGTTYYVTVTTARGTSGTSPTAVFTFQPLVPKINASGGLSPTSGLKSGGSSFGLTGTGFVSGMTVNFVEQVSGNPNPAVTLAATGVTVTGSTTLFASAPAVTLGSVYYVTVTTPGGTSAYGPVFTFS